jgi:tetratricopeptide (TPR) repeat protein
MNTNTNCRDRTLSRLVLGCGVAAALAASAGRAAAGDTTREEIDAIWRDPVFQKQFVGTYGINAEIEPRVTPDEVKILEKVRPLMASDLKKAAEQLRGSMKPDCSAVLDFTLGSIAFQQDDLESALRNYNKAVEKFPSFRRAWRNLGLIFVRTANWNAAIGAFIKMLELGGGDAYSYGLLGFAFAAKQDFQPAEAAYRNALMLQPESTEWRLGLTRCAFKQGKFADCEALLDVLITRYPDKAEFWLLQANTYLQLKQPLKAAQNFEAIDRIGKSTLDSLFTLGDVYALEGLHDLALGAYLRAVDFDLAQPIARPLRAAEALAGRNANAQAKLVVARIHQHWDAQMAPEDRRKVLKLQARIDSSEGGGTPETAALLEEIEQVAPLDGDALLLLGQYWQRKDEIYRCPPILVLVGRPQDALNQYQECERLLQKAFQIMPSAATRELAEQLRQSAPAHAQVRTRGKGKESLYPGQCGTNRVWRRECPAPLLIRLGIPCSRDGLESRKSSEGEVSGSTRVRANRRTVTGTASPPR